MRAVDLGLMAYGAAEALQLAALAEVQAGGEETLFLVEHPRVITLGLRGGRENLRVDAAVLASQGIGLVRTRRGGNITCHFPGQLVAYPIFRVGKRRGGIRRFFSDMEEAVVRTAAHFGVQAGRREGFPGVWTAARPGERTRPRKLCSMGIGVRRGVSYHGLALNVGPDVSLFDFITLCGIAGAAPTSLVLETGPVPAHIDMKEVKDVLAREFRALFAHPALAAGEAAQG
ncbi:MAG: lipoyl(octanoyl) transferase LipB [Proteobacteria bacterium]|nr:lipoyl(octanoyl) transferase LipB [Pseudomonadota bacterium]MBU1595687.1 lipoyl(octanoyl) transferase LipB [Pseudomonadota bacterium]